MSLVAKNPTASHSARTVLHYTSDLEHGTHGLAAMTSAYHAEGRQFDPGWVYGTHALSLHAASLAWPEEGRYLRGVLA